ncbi:MAG: glycosyltransferase family 4 protein [Candidatus Pacebacteria bacterium]|nr:glycosyltransferase family 4 protein [Candidatus Paceibacterota bacterium]
MKVLQISQYYSPRVGGVEKHLSRLNRELIKQGQQISVLTGNDDPQLASQELLDQVQVYRIDNAPAKNYKCKIWRQIIKNRRLLLDADIIHIHDVFWWIIPLYPLIFHKIYITFHGYESGDGPSNKAIFWHKLANKLAKGSIAIGGFHVKYYGTKTDYVIDGASDHDKTTNNKATQRKTAPKKIIFVGRLVSESGILSYLQALQILQDQGEDYHLDVFGNGPLMTQAQKYAQQKQLNVTFHGFVADAEHLFRQYPIAFVSSYLSICEALSQNCRVIAHYPNQFIKDYLSMSIYKDYIFMTDSAQKIAQAVIKAPVVKTFDNQVRQSLTWSTIAQSYQDLWQKK